MVKYGALVDQAGGNMDDQKILAFIEKGIAFEKPTHTHMHDGVPCDHDHS